MAEEGGFVRRPPRANRSFMEVQPPGGGFINIGVMNISIKIRPGRVQALYDRYDVTDTGRDRHKWYSGSMQVLMGVEHTSHLPVLLVEQMSHATALFGV